MIKPKICVLYSDVGAGHKAVAKSLLYYLSADERLRVSCCDFNREYKLNVFGNASELYRFELQFFPWFQEVSVWFFNNEWGYQILKQGYEDAAKPFFRKFYRKYPGDLYISCYYFDYELFRKIKIEDPNAKTVMVVTDIATPLRFWFNPIADLIIVPTQEMYDRGLRFFKKYKEKVKVMGLPVSPEFFTGCDRKQLKNSLGLDPNKKTILVFGGGEGMLQLPDIVKRLDKTLANVNIITVCGKNEFLKKQLAKKKFRNNCQILGWTDRFHDLLKCSDLVITKAGPTTIWECLVLNKPMIIYDYIRGQERGNIAFAKQHSANTIYEKRPSKIANRAVELLSQKVKPGNPAFITNWGQEICKTALKLIQY